MTCVYLNCIFQKLPNIVNEFLIHCHRKCSNPHFALLLWQTVLHHGEAGMFNWLSHTNAPLRYTICYASIHIDSWHWNNNFHFILIHRENSILYTWKLFKGFFIVNLLCIYCEAFAKSKSKNPISWIWIPDLRIVEPFDLHLHINDESGIQVFSIQMVTVGGLVTILPFLGEGLFRGQIVCKVCFSLCCV